MTMDVVTKLYESLISYVNNARNNFDQYETAAKEKNPGADYKDKFERKRIRSLRLTFFEGSSTSETPVERQGKVSCRYFHSHN